MTAAPEAQRRRRAEPPRDTALILHELPPRAVRAVRWFFVLTGALAFAVAAFVPFPQSASGRFVLASEGGADPLKAPRAGTLEAVRVKEGDRVKAGDVLFVLRSEAVPQELCGPEPYARRRTISPTILHRMTHSSVEAYRS